MITGILADYFIMESPNQHKINIIIEGALLPEYYANLSTHFMYIWVQLVATKRKVKLNVNLEHDDIINVMVIFIGHKEFCAYLEYLRFLFQNISNTWKIPVVTEKLIGIVPEIRHKKFFVLDNFNYTNPYYFLNVKLRTNLKANFPVSLGYNLQPISIDVGIIYAALVLCGLYILIIFEVTKNNFI